MTVHEFIMARAVAVKPKAVTALSALVVSIIVATIGAAPPTVVAYAALRASRASTEKVEVIDQKTDELTKKAEVIHVLVNSNLSTVQADLALANQRIEKLQKLIDELLQREVKGRK